ncbi:MAG: helix-turn-helix domain-containing protein, partial [Phycisphaeraceae bacterium]
SRLFKRVVGRTPQQYLLKWRVRHAQRMLMESDAAISEIARRVGYRDVHFFSRQFKQVTGVSPLRFRKQLRATQEAAGTGRFS